ncbi:MAG: DUF3137 domain-containing protein [Pseudomonadota bacterium]
MSTPISDDPSTPISPLIQQAINRLPSDISDFSGVYMRQLRPALLRQEAEWQKAREEATRWTFIGTAVGVIGSALALMIARVPQLAIVAAALGFAILGAGRSNLRRFSRRARSRLVELTAQQFELSFAETPDPKPGIDGFIAQGLLSRSASTRFSNLIKGERRGMAFELFSLNVQDKSAVAPLAGRVRAGRANVFDGICLRLHLGQSLRGRIKVSRQSDRVRGSQNDEGLQRVNLTSDRFEEAFDVYATDGFEARDLLTDNVFQSLVVLEKTFRAWDLQGIFAGDALLIVMPGGNLFETSETFTPLDYSDRICDLLDDVSALFKLIDSLAVPQASAEPS